MSPATPRRFTYSRQRLEQRILKSAEHAFSHTGFHGTSMETIAKGAKISKQNLIYYFPSKTILYQRVLEEILDIWIQEMSFNFSDRDQSPGEILLQYIRDKLQFSFEHPHASKVFAQEVIQGAPMLKGQLQSRLKKQFQKDTALIQQWIDDGLIQSVNPEHLFFIVWAATQTYADFNCQMQLLMNKTQLSKQDQQQALETISTIVFQGLGLNLPDRSTLLCMHQ